MKVAVLSDIHANIYALDAVLNALQKDNIEKILVAGDLIGYYYWPSEVVDICMKDARFICVKGNHEANLQVAQTNKEKLSSFERKYGSSYRASLETLNENQLEWLFNLPTHSNFQSGNTDFHMTHGSLSRIDEYVYPDTSINHFQQNCSASKITILGHTHYPFIHSSSNKWLINPGSVGQPRDVGNLASFFVVNTENGAIVPKRVPFQTDVITRYVDMYDKDLPYLKNIFLR